MSFSDTILAQPRPSSVREVLLPRREKYHPSPSDWRDEVLYFLLPDRFSDGREESRPPLVYQPKPRVPQYQFDRWSEWVAPIQGGTIRG
jgi:hypothetical protein